MADLVTLEEVEERLELSSPSAQVEAVVDAWRLALQQRVLDLTGFSLTAEQRTDEIANAQLGRNYLLQRRPISPMSSNPTQAIVVKARSRGSATLNTISGEISDEFRGKIVLLRALDTDDPRAGFGLSPEGASSAPWNRWRETVWPVVRVTYDVAEVPSSVRPILGRAVAEWVAFVYASKPQTGRVSSFTAEKISESYESNAKLVGAAPPIVSTLLSSLIRGTTSMVF